MSKTYAISMPITGFVYKEVEASSEEEAIDKFFELDTSTADIEEWDHCEAIVEGNVFHGRLNKVEIEEIED